MKLSWYLYDFANSSYATLIQSVYLVNYLKNFVGDDRADFLWGFMNSISMLIAVILGVILAVYADMKSKRKFFFIISTLITIVFTFLIPYYSIDGVIVLFIVANVAYSISYIFYNAFLPFISGGANASVSSTGWAIGYLGGLLSLLIAVLFKPDIFLLVSIFYFIFSIPSFLFIKEPHSKSENFFALAKETVMYIFKNKSLLMFFLSYFFAVDALNTILIFISSYAFTTYGLSQKEIFMLFIALNIVAFTGTFIAGLLSKKINSYVIYGISIIMWIIVVGGVGVFYSKISFFIFSCIGAVATGITQAFGRAIIADSLKPENASQIFSYESFFNKTSSITGPFLFGVLSSHFSQKIAVLAFISFFIISAIFLWRSIVIKSNR